MDRSLFARLPPELRNNIYELAVTKDKAIRIVIRTLKGIPRVVLYDYCSFTTTSLLFTCKIIYAESLPMFYGCNIFRLLTLLGNAPEALADCVTDMSIRRHLRFVRNLQVTVGELFEITQWTTADDWIPTASDLVNALATTREKRSKLPNCEISVCFTHKYTWSEPPLQIE